VAYRGVQHVCPDAGKIVSAVQIGTSLNGWPAVAESEPRGGLKVMKPTLSIVGLVLVIVGGIWVLQGIGVLPGSFMTGQIRWAVYGAISVAAGAAVLLAARRRSGRD
jgi:hypothetical protein